MDCKEKDPSGSQDNIAEMVVVALRRIIRAIDLRSRFLVTRHGLTGPQLTVLKELSVRDGVAVGQLTRAIHLSQATVTGILDRLARRDLIRRQRSKVDKRCVQVLLTGAGRRLLADAPPLLQEEFTDQFGQLEDWERTEILSALQRVVSMMEAKHIDASPILITGPVDETIERTGAFLNPQPEKIGKESEGTGPIEGPDPLCAPKAQGRRDD